MNKYLSFLQLVLRPKLHDPSVSIVLQHSATAASYFYLERYSSPTNNSPPFQNSKYGDWLCFASYTDFNRTRVNQNKSAHTKDYTSPVLLLFTKASGHDARNPPKSITGLRWAICVLVMSQLFSSLALSLMDGAHTTRLEVNTVCLLS